MYVPKENCSLILFFLELLCGSGVVLIQVVQFTNKELGVNCWGENPIDQNSQETAGWPSFFLLSDSAREHFSYHPKQKGPWVPKSLPFPSCTSLYPSSSVHSLYSLWWILVTNYWLCPLIQGWYYWHSLKISEYDQISCHISIHLEADIGKY